MKKIHTYIVLALVAIGCVSLAAPVVTNANAADEELKCGVLPPSICGAAKKGDDKTVEDTGVWKLLLLVVNIMTAGAAIAAVGGIVYGAVMYTTAGGNQEQVKKARGIITNVVIGVVAFAAMYALLQWLVPGGIF